MDYKLAKQLKEAGFPQFNSEYAYAKVATHQDKLGKWQYKIQKVQHTFQAGIEFVACPTLSELIDAVGDNFRLQNSKPGLWQADTCGDFNKWDDKKHILGTGKTPEEAVAKLYIALNEK